MILYLLVFLVVLIFCLIFRYVRKRINTSVPTIPDALSIYKNKTLSISLKDLFKRIMFVGERTNECGGAAKFIYGPLVFYVVSSPEDVSTVLTNCLKKMYIYSMIEPYVGSELVAAPVHVWKHNRRLIDHGFKPNVLDSYLELFNTQGRRLAVTMADEVNKEFDFTEIITRNMLETVCQTIMGKNINGQDIITDSYAKAINRVLEIMTIRVTKPWLMFDSIFNWSSLKKEQDENLKRIWSLSDQMVKKRKLEYIKRLQTNENVDYKENEFRSLLDIIIENTVSEDSAKLTDLQMRQLIDNLLVAGFDTLSPQVMYVLICIGSYPDVQRKVYEEVIDILGDEDRPITKSDLARFTYLEAVLKETIRLYPVGVALARTTTSEVQLRDYILPADSHVIVHLWAVNRNKEYWGPDADEFRPDRWFKDSVPSHPAAYSSFSIGRRNCVGKSYGMAFMKIIIANIVKKFTISADDKKVESEFAVLLKPSSGHLIKIGNRNNKKLKKNL